MIIHVDVSTQLGETSFSAVSIADAFQVLKAPKKHIFSTTFSMKDAKILLFFLYFMRLSVFSVSSELLPLV